MSAGDLAQLMARREVSPRLVLVVTLERIERADRALGAFVHLMPERAMAEASRLERELRRGELPGPLYGVPVAVKDIFHARGAPTSAGSLTTSVRARRADGPVVRAVRQAGAILIGKLATSEFGAGSQDMLTRPVNPRAPGYVPGGSSAGAGVAVAAGLVPLAVGGDTGGSVRIPASFCGIVGLRPTASTIDARGEVPLAANLDTPGPMARSAGDAALLLEALQGRPPESERMPRRVAVLPPRALLNSHPEVVGCYVDAVGKLTNVARVGESEAGSLANAVPAAWILIYDQALRYHRPRLRRAYDRYSRTLLWKLYAAAALTDDDRRVAVTLRAGATETLLRILGQFDVLATPTTGHPAYPRGGLYAGRDTMEWTAVASLAGLPALSIPCGMTAAGLPIGLQLVGRPGQDRGLLKLAGQFGAGGSLGVSASTEELTQRAPSVPEPRPDGPALDADRAAVTRGIARHRLPSLDVEDLEAAAVILHRVRSWVTDTH